MADQPNEAPSTSHEKKVPDYAHTVVVPIANPKTAHELLNLALGVVQRDGGRVIALAVTLSDGEAEEKRERLDELENIVEEHKPSQKPKAAPLEEGANNVESSPSKDEHETEDKSKTPPVELEFVTRTSMSIARGILDQVRETGAELIILGVQKSVRGNVVLGSVAQAVMSAAPCDVLVYRYSSSPSFDRIVVPVDGSQAARMAVRMGIIFANANKHCPVEAIHVQSGTVPTYEGRVRIEQTLEGIAGRGIVKPVVVNGRDPAAAILSRVDEQHLIIVGFTRRSDFERWIYDEDKNLRAVLDKAPGPVLLAVRSTEAVSQSQRLLRQVMSWLRPKLTDIEQEQITWDANTNAGIDLDYVVLMLVSATLASLGLLLDSAAVIIGAMLVAPLMSPLNAFGIGLSTARLDLTRRSFVTVVVGVVIASLVGLVMGLVVPLESPTDEMMSRVSPTLLDAFVALASGVVGSYATARKDIPAALAGVAIAAALVPPICTFGLQLAFGQPEWALGAMLLFLTNMICIIVIASIMFVWLGMHPDRLSLRRASYISLIIFVLLAFPATLTVLGTLQQADEAQEIEREIRVLFSPVDVANVELVSQSPLTVTATVRTPNDISTEAIVAAEAYLAERLEAESVQLQLIVERLALSPAAETEWLERHRQQAGADALLVIEDGEVVPMVPDIAVTEEAEAQD